MTNPKRPASSRRDPLAWGEWGRCWWCGRKLSRLIKGRARTWRLRRKDTKYCGTACGFQAWKWERTAGGAEVSRGTGGNRPQGAQ